MNKTSEESIYQAKVVFDAMVNELRMLRNATNYSKDNYPVKIGSTIFYKDCPEGTISSFVVSVIKEMFGVIHLSDGQITKRIDECYMSRYMID